jgi:hypothetical protein
LGLARLECLLEKADRSLSVASAQGIPGLVNLAGGKLLLIILQSLGGFGQLLFIELLGLFQVLILFRNIIYFFKENLFLLRIGLGQSGQNVGVALFQKLIELLYGDVDILLGNGDIPSCLNIAHRLGNAWARRAFLPPFGKERIDSP